MFLKKVLFNHFGKILKYKYKHKLNTFYYLFGVTPRHFNSQALFFSINREIKGINKPILSSGKFIEIKSNEKYMSEVSDIKCWKCNSLLELKNFCCKSCGALQFPKNKISYFELLGVSQIYDIDLDNLTQNFRNKQMIFHPDKFANKSKEECEISETYSTLLNKAYSTLKDPLARGFYLLELQKTPEPDVVLDQEFLLAIMEKNEELEHIESMVKLSELMKANDDSIKTQIFLVGDSFRANQLLDAKIHLLKLSYFINLSKKMKEIQNNFLITKYT